MATKKKDEASGSASTKPSWVTNLENQKSGSASGSGSSGYLEEQGQHIAAVATQREADRGYNMDRAEQYQAVADVLGTTDPEAIGSMNLKELRDQHGEALERAYPGMTKSALRMSGVLRQVQAYLEGRDS